MLRPLPHFVVPVDLDYLSKHHRFRLLALYESRQPYTQRVNSFSALA